ncbi:hypothetical protein SK128_027128 [Halocaridina rubra]|uniref:Uncharacterized protein n=1 Tax=Halocaridina rubra TaxID=373956 RepID=A0AAN8WZ80_HALRR
MVSLSQSACLSRIEHLSHMTPESNMTCSTQANLSSQVTHQGSPQLAQRKKSRIPRYLPLPSVKSTPVLVDKKPSRNSAMSDTSAKSKTEPERKAKIRLETDRRKSTSELLREQCATITNHAVAPARPVDKTAAPEPMEITQEVKEEVKISSPPPQSSSELEALAKPSPVITARKDSTRRERPARILSDARKIKRMVIGVAPLDAAVDCASAPEWRSRSPLGSKSDVEVTCVPRPQNLHITRRVGVDGVVIAWAPLEHDCVAGFQVLVGGRVVQHVRSPHRTKALVTGLPLAGSFTIGLVTVAEDGRCSTPVIVTQDRTRVYASRNSSARPLRRGVPTCL